MKKQNKTKLRGGLDERVRTAALKDLDATRSSYAGRFGLFSKCNFQNVKNTVPIKDSLLFLHDGINETVKVLQGAREELCILEALKKKDV